MEGISIRQVHGEDMLRIIQQLPGYALRASPPLVDQKVGSDILDERLGSVYYALFEEEKPVACVAWVPMTQHVRGVILPMGGIYDVATHPAARRKGYARALMQKAFAGMAEGGNPVSSLYPFRESFYESLGYASFSQPTWASLHPSRLSRLLKADLQGEVELAFLSESFDEYHGFLQRYQQRQPGMGLFTGRPLFPGKRRDFWVAKVKTGGEISGAAVYTLSGDRPMQYDMRILRFYYLESRARYLLLEWIARHVDQAHSVEILLSPGEHPELWLADIGVKVSGETFCGMGRVLDIPKIAGVHVGPGKLNLRIDDPYCPWNDGDWQFGESGGRLIVERTADAVCTLKIQGLSALVYGTHDPQDFVFRGWGDPSPDLQAQMRTMFPRQNPYLHEFF